MKVMHNTGLARQLWEDARLWRRAALVLATTALALLVAALVTRESPDFAQRPVITVLRDAHQRPAWTLRLAPNAHQIAVDSLSPPPPPTGKNYELWLVAPGEVTPQPLALLPLTGHKIFAETPANIRRLAGPGELRVTLEPRTGTFAPAPNGQSVFHATLKPEAKPGEVPREQSLSGKPS